MTQLKLAVTKWMYKSAGKWRKLFEKRRRQRHGNWNWKTRLFDKHTFLRLCGGLRNCKLFSGGRSFMRTGKADVPVCRENCFCRSQLNVSERKQKRRRIPVYSSQCMLFSFGWQNYSKRSNPYPSNYLLWLKWASLIENIVEKCVFCSSCAENKFGSKRGLSVNRFSEELLFD